MKKNLIFLWQATIPALWILSVLFALYEGFRRGFIQPVPIEYSFSYHYPWTGVILAILKTTLECIFLYFILQPNKFTWSLYRVGSAFVVTVVLSLLANWTTPTDQPGYAYVFEMFSSSLSLLLFILLIITAIKTATCYISTSTAS